jgi:hypothetical protein
VSLVGKKNAYQCRKCGKYTITVDVDEGVTPMLLGCRADGSLEPTCEGQAVSMFYPPEPWPDDVPTEPQFEWFRPTGAEYDALSPEMKEHVDKGGLDLRVKVSGGVDRGEGVP